MSTAHTPPNSLKTTAIALLFKDGFSVQDLVEIFTLSPDNIEEHVRRAMFNGPAKLPETDHRPPLQKVADKPEPGPGPAPRPEAPAITKPGPAAAEKRKRGIIVCAHDNPPRDKRGRCRICAAEYQRDYQAKKKTGVGLELKAKPARRKYKEIPERSRPITQAEANRPAASSASLGSTTGDAATPPVPADELEPGLNSPDAGAMEDTFRKIASRVKEKPEPGAKAPALHAAACDDKLYSQLIKCPKCGNSHRFWKRADADPNKDHWISMGCANTLKILNYNIKVDRNHRPGSEE